MKSVIKISKTIDEAVRLGAEELGSTVENVEFEVLEEPTKGFLGLIGGKDATVKVILKNDPAEMAEVFLKDVLRHMDVEANFTINKKDAGLFIDIDDISSKDMGIIIGKRGNTLDAIQYLISLHVNRDSQEYVKVFLDAKGYRAKREKTLRQLAKNMAKKTARTKRPVKLEPMNPYERRIIHSALQNENGIITYSEGEDPYRRVVIKEENK